MNIIKHGYQNMVLEYYVQKLKSLRKKRVQRLASIHTQEEALAYQQQVQSAISQAFAPFPEKTPLNAETTGCVQCKSFHIENVRFYSRPDFMVTASLYIPDNITEKAPAILGTCGHSGEGRFFATYQKFALRLVMNGFIVLLVDPIHQGERYQYVGLKNLGLCRGLCTGHNAMGKQLALLGESMPSWRVWDGIRALDYLMQRPEVDATRVGITGNSGGGTLTEWLWANDSRLAFAAPSCHVTTFMRNLENELPTDAEQCPYNVLGNGLEMVDMMLCRAPKPALLLGQYYDFFDRFGLKEAYSEMKQFYAHFGAEKNAQLFIDNGPHGYSDNLQRAMLHFFHQVAGLPGEINDEQPVVNSSAVLQSCSTGNAILEGSKPIYAIMSEMAISYANKRIPPQGKAWIPCLKKLFNLPPMPSTPPHFRVLRPQFCKQQTWARYAIETENDIKVILRKRVDNPSLAESLDISENVVLYLPDYSAEIESRSSLVKALNNGNEIYAIDVRGLGESMPEDTPKDFYQGYGMDFMMYSFGFMLGESYQGRRIYDVLRTLDFLKAQGTKSISLVGNGQGALLAAFVGILRPELTSITLHKAPKSFKKWLDDKICHWLSPNMPFGVLKFFDLPDVYAALGKRLKIAR